jgi:hypothetical protein
MGLLLANWTEGLVGITRKDELLAGPVDCGYSRRVGNTEPSDKFCVVSSCSRKQRRWLTLRQHLETRNTTFTPRIPFPIIFALDASPSSRVHGGDTAVVAPNSSFLDGNILEWFKLGNLIRLHLR